MKTIIYVDAYPLVNNAQAGIGQYTLELVRQLNHDPHLKVVLLLFRNETLATDNLSEDVEIEKLPLLRRPYSLAWKLLPPLNIQKYLKYKNPDWVIYPNFGMMPRIKAVGTKTITVVHDLTYLHYPHTVEARNLFYLRKAVSRATRDSDFIFTPSRFTAEDLMKNYGVREERIRIAYPGYTETSTGLTETPARLRALAGTRFLFFLGTIEPRKNLEALCRAYLGLSEEQRNNFRLIIAGRKGWGDVAIPHDEQIITLGAVSNEERGWLLDNCAAFTFPSIFEGFGMPVIEAMRHKKPVLTSRSSSLNEIANDTNSYLVDEPFGEKEIANQLDTLLRDLRDSQHQKKALLGHEKSLEFTWEKCAQPYIDVIKNQENSAE